MVRIGIVGLIGGFAISIALANYFYIQYQPNFITVNAGEPIQVGPVKYIIEHLGEHNGNEDTRPKGTFFKIRIIAENTGTENTRMFGGQFYIFDESDQRTQAEYGAFSDEDLLNDILEPGRSVTWTTQFDIEYDEQEQYKIGIMPSKEQASIDIGMVCVTNC